MQSKAATVDDYIAEVPEGRRAALERWRDLCREILTDCEECILYGMPAYRRGGDLVMAFASQKNHLAFYGGHGAIQRHAAQLAGVDQGKGCLRYRRADQIDFEVTRSMLKDIAANRRPMC